MQAKMDRVVPCAADLLEGASQFEPHQTVVDPVHALLGDRRAQDVLAQGETTRAIARADGSCGVQGEAELGDAERGSDVDAGLPVKSDRVALVAILALRSRGSKPVDRRARQGGQRRLPLSECRVDDGQL
jgi:hypothetical protein